MAQEIEIKLLVAPGLVERVPRLALLHELACRASCHKRLVSTYFDTPDLTLRKRGLGLRVRRDGGRRIQTLKEKVHRGEGLFIREELENPIEGDRPDLSLFRGTPYEPFFSDMVLQKALRALFTTDFQRTAWQLEPARGVRVEMALDIGEVRYRQAREPICELELELIVGSPADLERLAARLLEVLPLDRGTVSKAARGYALFQAEAQNLG